MYFVYLINSLCKILCGLGLIYINSTHIYLPIFSGVFSFPLKPWHQKHMHLLSLEGLILLLKCFINIFITKNSQNLKLIVDSAFPRTFEILQDSTRVSLFLPCIWKCWIILLPLKQKLFYYALLYLDAIVLWDLCGRGLTALLNDHESSPVRDWEPTWGWYSYVRWLLWIHLVHWTVQC